MADTILAQANDDCQTTSIDRLLFFFSLVMIATIAIVAAGVERGIERACTLLMPVFVLLLVSLSGYGLSLDGAGRAMSFMFMPDWDALRRPTTYLAAIGPSRSVNVLISATSVADFSCASGRCAAARAGKKMAAT